MKTKVILVRWCSKYDQKYRQIKPSKHNYKKKFTRTDESLPLPDKTLICKHVHTCLYLCPYPYSLKYIKIGVHSKKHKH